MDYFLKGIGFVKQKQQKNSCFSSFRFLFASTFELEQAKLFKQINMSITLNFPTTEGHFPFKLCVFSDFKWKIEKSLIRKQFFGQILKENQQKIMKIFIYIRYSSFLSFLFVSIIKS